MSFTGAFICTSFKAELLQGIHNTAVAGDTFKIALYTSSASLTAATTVYSATNETSGTGYVAGGIALTNVTPLTSGTTAYGQWASPTFITVTLTCRGALIYNSSKANRACVVLDFGSDKSPAATNFTINMPTFAAGTALIQFN